MAEEKDKKGAGKQPQSTSTDPPMTSSTPSTPPPDPDPDGETAQAFQDFHEGLEKLERKETLAAVNRETNNKTNTEDANARRKASWQKAKLTWEEYTAINQRVGIPLFAGAGDLITKLDGYHGQNKAIDDQLGKAAEKIRMVRKKVQEVVNSVNQLEQSVISRCNQAERNKLELRAKLSQRVEGLKQLAETIQKEAGDNYETSVKAAGVKALINTGSLADMGKNIEAEASAFAKDVKTQLTAAVDKTTKTAEGFDQSSHELQLVNSNLFAAELDKTSIDKVYTWTGPDADREIDREIDAVVTGAEKNVIPGNADPGS